jgi:hypothetical protein
MAIANKKLEIIDIIKYLFILSLPLSKASKKLAKIINPNRTVLANTVHLNGVAGAGKTEVQLKHIRNRYSD